MVPAGGSMPLDPGSQGAEDGNIAVWQVRGGTTVYGREIPPGGELKPHEFRYRNHWATCLDPKRFKAPAGWWHSLRRRRWEYRARQGSPVQHWVSDEQIRHDWDAAYAYAAEATGGVPLPDEARPAGQQGSLM